MKKMLCIFIVALCLTINLKAQTPKLTGNIEASATRTNRHANDADADATNWNKLVFAAQQVYSKKDASEFTTVKLKQVNYLYSKSFELKDPDCSAGDINYAALFSNRQEDKRITIPVKTKEGCTVNVTLLSHNEVQKEFKKIETENN